MKKYILLSSGIYTYLLSIKDSVLNVFVIANIEALSFDESDTGIQCIGNGLVDCPYSGDKVEYVLSGYSLKYKR